MLSGATIMWQKFLMSFFYAWGEKSSYMHLCGKLITPTHKREQISPKYLVKGVESICTHTQIDDLHVT